MKDYAIALGSWYAYAAGLNQQGAAEIIPNSIEGEDSLRCAILRTDEEEVIVGTAAEEQSYLDEGTYKENLALNVEGRDPEDIRLVLHRLLEIAAANGELIRRPIFVSSYRQHMDEMHRIADAEGIQPYYISEETANAAYIEKVYADRVGCIFIVDISGDSLKLSAFQKDEEGIRLLYRIHLDEPMGSSITRIVENLLYDRIYKETGVEVSELTEEYGAEIHYRAERIKQILSARESATRRFLICDVPIKIKLFRSELEEAVNQQLRKKVTDSIQEALHEIGILPDYYMLLGGSSRMPIMQDIIGASLSAKRLFCPPTATTALGAVYYTQSSLNT